MHFRLAKLVALVAFALPVLSLAQTVTYDFDSALPTLNNGNGLPIDQTKDGLTAHFSADSSGFSVQSDSSVASVPMTSMPGHYLYPSGTGRTTLTITFSKSLTAISLTFATVDYQDNTGEVPSDLLLTAKYDGSTGTSTVGSAHAHGTYGGGNFYPTGTLSFTSSPSQPFNKVELVVPSSSVISTNTWGTTVFLADNIVCTPASTLTFPVTAFRSGNGVTGLLDIGAIAPAGGATVTLTSSAPEVSVPATLKIAAGTSTKAIPIKCGFVTTSKPVTIEATCNGNKVSQTLNLLPPVFVLDLSPMEVIGGSSTVVTGKITCSGAAPTGGLAVSLSSSIPTAADPGTQVGIAAGARSASFTVNHFVVANLRKPNIIASWLGVQSHRYLNVLPPKPVTVSLSPSSVVGGSSTVVNVTVTISLPAPAGGLRVSLTSSDPTLAVPPAIITVPAGSSQLSFHLKHLPTSVAGKVHVTATTISGSVDSSDLEVLPPSLDLMTLATYTVSAAATSEVTGATRLNGPAPAGDYPVTLTSSDPSVASVPATTYVVAGNRAWPFTVTIHTVTKTTKVLITASDGKVTKTRWLTVTP